MEEEEKDNVNSKIGGEIAILTGSLAIAHMLLCLFFVTGWRLH